MSESTSSKFWAFEEAYKNCHFVLLRNKSRLEQHINREEVEATINKFIERTKQMELNLKGMWEKIAFTHPEIVDLAKSIDEPVAEKGKEPMEEVRLLRVGATGVKRTQELLEAHMDRMAYEKNGAEGDFKFVTYRSTRDDDDDDDDDDDGEESPDSSMSLFPAKK